MDPDVQETDQPYVFVNDDPLNAEDPLGLCVKCSTDITQTGKNPTGDEKHITITNLNGDANGTITIIGGSNIHIVVQDEGDGFVFDGRSPGNESASVTTKSTGASANRGLFEAGDIADFAIPSSDASIDIFNRPGGGGAVLTGEYLITVRTTPAFNEIVGDKVTVYYSGKVWKVSPLT